MSELTSEYIEENSDMNYGESTDDWIFISSKLLDYNEGTTSTQYVFKNNADGELWAFKHYANSWAEDWETGAPYRVEPVEVTKIEYKKVKKVKND